MERLMSGCSMGTSSSIPSRSIRPVMRSAPKMRIRSSSSDRKKCELPGSPWRPARPRSWLSMRRDSWRSVPRMCKPPAASTSRRSASHWGLNLAKATVELFGVDLGAGLAGGLGIDLGARHELRVAAQDDVGSTAGHVGRDGDRALAAGLRDHVGLALVLLGIEHAVRDAFLAQQRRHDLGFLDADRADQHGLAARVAVLDLGQHGAELARSFLYTRSW
jgi:hypothetical protein